MIYKRFSLMSLLNGALLGLCGLVMFIPFWHILMYSISSYSQVIGKNILLRPYGFTMDAIMKVLSDPNILTAYLNTIFIVVVGTALSLAVTVLTAYPLACRVGGHRVISLLIYFTMLFSGGMIPTFYVVRMTGLFDTLWSLIIPSLISPFYVFIMRNFFQQIPDSLIESATIDGASQFRVFLQIVLPLSVPVIVTIVLFYAVAYWNSFFNAIIYIRSADRRPLQLILRDMIQSTSPEASSEMASDFSASDLTPTTLKMATVAVAVVPIMCIYPFLQKYFVKGVMIGAVKS